MSVFNNISRRKFIYGCSCVCASSLILPSCTEVALSDRQQLNIFTDDYLYSLSFPAYEKFKSESKIITGTNEDKQINDIGKRISEAINVYYKTTGQENPTSNFEYEFVLVDEKYTKNAWCMPGGKIAFYSGILPILMNKDGIATVMGHEIAHAVARHSAERASTAYVTNLGVRALEQLVLKQKIPQEIEYVRKFGLDLPYNRKQESEADYLGLIFMSLAGYNVNESYKVWERMKNDKSIDMRISNLIPEFLKTHPSHDNRSKKLKEWIPLVNENYPAINT